MEIGIQEAINLTVADWYHVQELDYEQLPFKCRHCHGYGHFVRHCKKKVEDEAEKVKGEEWTKVQKMTSTKQFSKPRVKGALAGSSAPSTEQLHVEGITVPP